MLVFFLLYFFSSLSTSSNLFTNCFIWNRFCMTEFLLKIHVTRIANIFYTRHIIADSISIHLKNLIIIFFSFSFTIYALITKMHFRSCHFSNLVSLCYHRLLLRICQDSSLNLFLNLFIILCGFSAIHS